MRRRRIVSTLALLSLHTPSARTLSAHTSKAQEYKVGKGSAALLTLTGELREYKKR